MHSKILVGLLPLATTLWGVLRDSDIDIIVWRGMVAGGLGAILYQLNRLLAQPRLYGIGLGLSKRRLDELEQRIARVEEFMEDIGQD